MIVAAGTLVRGNHQKTCCAVHPLIRGRGVVDAVRAGTADKDLPSPCREGWIIHGRGLVVNRSAALRRGCKQIDTAVAFVEHENRTRVPVRAVAKGRPRPLSIGLPDEHHHQWIIA